MFWLFTVRKTLNFKLPVVSQQFAHLLDNNTDIQEIALNVSYLLKHIYFHWLPLI